ncbi:hypothetical protein Pla123a_30370 [Posidoniimonas polymericola]|uniref:Autotransporter-associated beta strand repeat protein n=1 Tax=Posidoniimonas polymericola TaxID=2528002 RepID=A0A5C5YKZ9_9BACT|nr:hypothetical protein [Posidoniimonas polymericola]TWT75527.1 hypothetical protein Pla123a_30370 [Posidoniimonas polymericola]
MRTKLTIIGSLGLVAFALQTSVVLGQGPGTANYWLPADDTYTSSNDAAWSIGFVPDFNFDEAAVVTTNDNATTPLARVSGSLSTQPGALYIGELIGESGAVRVESGGNLTIGYLTGNSALGGVNVGLGGVGFLDVLPGGTLDGGYLTLGGQGGSVATLGGTAAGVTSVTIQGGGGNDGGEFGTTIGAQNTLRVVGPNVDYNTFTFQLASGGTLAAGITGASHSIIKSTNAVGINGTLRLDFDGVTPTVGDSWDLFDTPGVNGAFSSIEATGAAALPIGQTYVFSSAADGASTHGVVGRVSVEQRLVLSVNRDTGAVAIQNGAMPVSFDGYSISSQFGALNPSSWNSLDDQGVSDWRESPANGSGTRLSELKPTTSTAVSAGPGFNLGNVFDYATPTEFGAETEDLAFEYYTEAGDKFQGTIIYEGIKFNNNLLLVVDPADGQAQLVNDSSFDINLDGYWISSVSGSLQGGNGDWNSLDDQNAAGGAWTEANPTANNLVELQAQGDTMLAAGARYNLGTLFDTAGEQDLVLRYLFPEDETFTRFGAVDYRAVDGGLTGDYNGDGVVNAADYTVWRDADGSSVPPGTGADGSGDGLVNGADYDLWVANYGASVGASVVTTPTATPEPSALVVLLFVSAAACNARMRASR